MESLVASEQLLQAIVYGEISDAKALAGQLLEQEGMIVGRSSILGIVVDAMERVGVKFEEGVFFLPELVLAARAAEMCMSICQSIVTGASSRDASPTVVLGTVMGDVHDLGKNIVGMMLSSMGYHVVDLGVNVAPQEFVQATKYHEARIVGLSALLDTTLVRITQTIELFTQAGIKDEVKIIIGGRAVSEAFARSTGADGYAANAVKALKLVQSFDRDLK